MLCFHVSQASGLAETPALRPTCAQTQQFWEGNNSHGEIWGGKAIVNKTRQERGSLQISRQLEN